LRSKFFVVVLGPGTVEDEDEDEGEDEK